MENSLLKTVQDWIFSQQNRAAAYKADVDNAIKYLSDSAGDGSITLYVDHRTGNDSNVGTASKPLKTISAAAAVGRRYALVNIVLLSSYPVEIMEDMGGYVANLVLFLNGHTLWFKPMKVNGDNAKTDPTADYNYTGAATDRMDGYTLFSLHNIINLRVVMGGGNIVYPPCETVPSGTRTNAWEVSYRAAAFRLAAHTTHQCGVQFHGYGGIHCLDATQNVAPPGLAKLVGSAWGGVNQYDQRDQKNTIQSWSIFYRYMLNGVATVANKPQLDLHYPGFIGLGWQANDVNTTLSNVKPLEDY